MRRSFAIALSVALTMLGMQTPGRGAEPNVGISTGRVHCGWDPATRTLWPAVRVYRSALSSDSRVTATVQLRQGETVLRQLGVGRVRADGSVNQNGFVDGPPSVTGVPALSLAEWRWIRPWGGKFGDGAFGGPPLAAGVYTLRFRLIDFSSDEFVFQDIACSTAGPFELQATTYSTVLLEQAAVVPGSLPLLQQHPPVTLADVVASIATEGRTTASCDPPGVVNMFTAFCWSDAGDGENDDFNSGEWKPQGIAGSGESGLDGNSTWEGVPPGKSLLAVTWYRDGGDHATRLSLLDLTTFPVTYRHLDLFAACDITSPCPLDGGFKPLTGSHVGGVAWAGRYLYVADTSLGFRVFDLTKIFDYGTESPNRFVLPEVVRYTQTDQCPSPIDGVPTTEPCALTFSFASVASGLPRRLVSGEFADNGGHHEGARIVSWPLNADGTIATGDRAAQKDDLIGGTDLIEFQGVAVAGALGEKLVLSSSYGNGSDGKRHAFASRAPASPSTTIAWPTGVEDLYVSEQRNQLWTLTEFAGKRWVWAEGFSAALGW